MNLSFPRKRERYSWTRINRTIRLRPRSDINKKKWLTPGNKLLKIALCPKAFEKNPFHLTFH
jgi:hypothetical protein